MKPEPTRKYLESNNNIIDELDTISRIVIEDEDYMFD